MGVWIIRLFDFVFFASKLYREAKTIAKQLIITVEILSEDGKIEKYEKKAKAMDELERKLTELGYNPPQYLLRIIDLFIDITISILNKRFGKRWVDVLSKVSEFVEKL